MLLNCPMGKLSKITTRSESIYFRGFFIIKLRTFYNRLLVIPKDNEFLYNNFFGKLKILLHLGFPWRIWSAKYPSLRSWYSPCKVVVKNCNFPPTTFWFKRIYMLKSKPLRLMFHGINWFCTGRQLEGGHPGQLPPPLSIIFVPFAPPHIFGKTFFYYKKEWYRIP